MFVPIHDKNPLKRIPFQYVTVGIIVLNIVLYVVFQSGWVFPIDERVAAFALIPAEFWSGQASLTGDISVPEGALPVQGALDARHLHVRPWQLPASGR